MARVVSCLRPTGGMHIGQYFGAVSRWREMQRDHDCFFGIGDLHQLTVPGRAAPGAEPDTGSWRRTVETALDLRACGIDFEKGFVFAQSLVPEHAELCWILQCVCPHGDLTRIPLFKNNSERAKAGERLMISAGLFAYPVLQAADILLYGGERVPVGKDQEAHVELARKLARTFNSRYGKVFNIPEIDLGPTPRIMSLQDPESKMSRRGEGRDSIALFESEESLRAKIDSAVTDSGVLTNGAPSPGVANLLEILKACDPGAEALLRDELRDGKLPYKDLKATVAGELARVLAPLRERRQSLDPRETEDLLREMSGAVRRHAAATLDRVRDAMGLPGKSHRPPGNWWRFSVDRHVRSSAGRSRLGGFMDVNPELDGGRFLTYQSYLGLDALLSCQTPGSKIPDERVFIVTHQLIEIVFKMMVFDCAVIAATFKSLLARSDDDLWHLLQPDHHHDPFWQPALTASSRIEFSAGTLLPNILQYLERDELFSTREFYFFREGLAPASGFQSAQFRLLQRALGKSPIMDVRLFPGHEYRASYRREGEGQVRVVDELVLREGHGVATPAPESGLDDVAGLDRLAHELLARIAEASQEEHGAEPIKLITDAELEQEIDSFRRLLANFRKEQSEQGHTPTVEELARDETAVETFRLDLNAVVQAENQRRGGLAGARRGAFVVKRVLAGSCLERVLERLQRADVAFHGSGEGSFLHAHYQMAKKRIEKVKSMAPAGVHPPSGTGGGGIEYLAFAQKLLEMFPALVAFRDKEGGRSADDFDF